MPMTIGSDTFQPRPGLNNNRPAANDAPKTGPAVPPGGEDSVRMAGGQQLLHSEAGRGLNPTPATPEQARQLTQGLSQSIRDTPDQAFQAMAGRASPDLVELLRAA